MRLFFTVFLILLKVIEADYLVLGIYDFGEKKIEYGNLTTAENLNGFIRIYDEQDSEAMQEIIYDTGEHNVFKYLAIVSEDTFIIVCNNYYINQSQEYVSYINTSLLLYDTEGILQNEINLSEKPIDVHNHNFSIVISYENSEIIFDKDLNQINGIEIQTESLASFEYQYQGKATINGSEVSEINIQYPGIYDVIITENTYVYDFTVTVHPDCKITGNKYLEGYIGSVYVYSYGDIYVNNEEYIIGSEIKRVGNYNVMILGENNYRKDIQFTILPDIIFYDGVNRQQLLENSKFSSPVKIYSNAQTMFLNDQTYSSAWIDNPGNYVVSFYGVNNYIVDINFTILPSVSGVTNNETYEQVSFSVFGKALLNGKEIFSEQTISKVGNYKLELLLDEEVYQTINFSIVKENAFLDENPLNYLEYLKYLFLLLTVVGGVLILRKK